MGSRTRARRRGDQARQTVQRRIVNSLTLRLHSDSAFQPRSETSDRNGDERNSRASQDSDGDATDGAFLLLLFLRGSSSKICLGREVMTDSDDDSRSPALRDARQAGFPSAPRDSQAQPAPPAATSTSAPDPSPPAFRSYARPPSAPAYPPQAVAPPTMPPPASPPSFARPPPASPPISTAQQQQADLHFIETHPAPPPQVWAQERAAGLRPSVAPVSQSGRVFGRSASVSDRGLPGAFTDRSPAEAASGLATIPSSGALVRSRVSLCKRRQSNLTCFPASVRTPLQTSPQYPQTQPYTPAPATASSPSRLPGAFMPRVSSASPAPLPPPVQSPPPAYQVAPRQAYLPASVVYPASPPVPSAPQPYTAPLPRSFYVATPPLQRDVVAHALSSSPTPDSPAQPDSTASTPSYSPVDYAAAPDPRASPTAPPSSADYQQQPPAAFRTPPTALAYPASSYPQPTAPAPAQAFEPVAASSQPPRPYASSPYMAQQPDPPPPAQPAMSAFVPQPSSVAEPASPSPAPSSPNDSADDRFSPRPSSSAQTSARPRTDRDQPSRPPTISAADSDVDGTPSDEDASVPKSETPSRCAGQSSDGRDGPGDESSPDNETSPFVSRRARQVRVQDQDLPSRDGANRDDSEDDAFQPRTQRPDEADDSGPEQATAPAPTASDDSDRGRYHPRGRARDASDASTTEHDDSRGSDLDDLDAEPDTASRSGGQDFRRDQPDSSRSRQLDATPSDDVPAESDDGDSFTPRARSRGADADTDGVNQADSDVDGSAADRSQKSQDQDGPPKDVRMRGDEDRKSLSPADSGGQQRDDGDEDFTDDRHDGGTSGPGEDGDARKSQSTGPSSLSDDELDADDPGAPSSARLVLSVCVTDRCLP